jgi:protein-tyrosine phosphatase
MDVPWENLGKYFMESAVFIQKAIKQGGVVFVHCWAGISRSTSCIAAYLMLEYGMTLPNGLNLIR